MKNNNRFIPTRLSLLGFLFFSLLVTSTSSLLSGCGWRLRGSINLPPVMAKTYIQGVAPFSELGLQLKSSLNGADAEVVEHVSQATASLVILGNDVKRRVLAIDKSGQASEYELSYVLRFTVLDEKGKQLMPEQTVTATRDYQFDPNAILAKGDEEAKLRKDMLRFAVQQMFFRINAGLRSAALTSQSDSQSDTKTDTQTGK
ncbi:MAG: LPS assembly lipoprotein LptE [Gammaproteobacteria bacterium]|nr:LPS assembly lipoprotein LptE [Gammaproteobacteria bacterium]